MRGRLHQLCQQVRERPRLHLESLNSSLLLFLVLLLSVGPVKLFLHPDGHRPACPAPVATGDASPDAAPVLHAHAAGPARRQDAPAVATR